MQSVSKAAPAGENVDRESMTVEDEDRDKLPRVLREAKEKGLKTVVILNISGPVEMISWLPYADSVLCIFLPGCMGGVATARMLTGEAFPGGKLPISLPARYEDTPSYPNFPGEYNDVYYGEGIFVGYRNYEKRKLPVQFPFGFGLSYTTFTVEPVQTNFVFDTREQKILEISVKIKNTGSRRGSEVVQIYACEEKPRVLRPVKELVGFAKVTLEPGKEAIATVCVRRESLRYFDAKQRQWVTPVGALRLFIAQSSADICFEAALEVRGINPYPLSGESTIGEILQNPAAVMLVNQYAGNMFDQLPKETLDFMINRKLGDILSIGMIAVIPDAVKLNAILQELYDKLSTL